jgi:hypothetical protein
VTEPAPPYAGEGAPALWHVSEEPAIERFEPRLCDRHSIPDEALVWAVDTRHLPLYWFPRDCPRATFWANGGTSPEDVGRWLDGDPARRVHVVESAWLPSMREARLYAYRLPEEPFEPWDRFFVSRVPVEPIEIVALGDLLGLHAGARIELRFAPALHPLWDDVVRSTLDFSGIRLRNATMAR